MTGAVLLAAWWFFTSTQRITESVVVVASSEARIAAAATGATLAREALSSSPAFTLDQKLGATPGFSLFRRNSSRTANPTTQGVTLRGVAASGASRTLVTADDLPLNDPLGGWVYWNRLPEAAIDRVDVTRGGTSDLFGSDALAGAINIVMRRDTAAEVHVAGGGDDTARVSAYAGRVGPLSAFAGGEAATMGGYVPVAPESRGAIDTPAGSRHRSVVTRIGLPAWSARVEAGGSWLSEDRDNGTPAQTNATRIAAGFASARGNALGGFWILRGHRQVQDYDQSFSAVADDRASERLTTRQALDGTAHTLDAAWARTSGRVDVLLSLFGGNTAVDSINRAFLPSGAVITTAGSLPGQRSIGAAAQIVARPIDRLTVSAGIRGERRSLEAVRDYTMAGPRAALSWQFTPGIVGRVSASSSYRAPTMNELYRSFRVGDILTRANDDLEPERARGIETSLTMTRGRVTTRAVAFLSRVSGTIYSQTLTGQPPPGLRIERRRANGDAESRGVELEVEARPATGVSLWLASTVLDTEFTSGELDGNRLPQVPRLQAAAGAAVARGRWSTSFELRHAARQFDDDRNRFELRPATTANAMVAMRFRYAQVFAAVENLFDADVDAGRTPLRTIGQPRVWQVGVRVAVRR